MTLHVGDRYASQPKYADPWGVNKPLNVTIADLKDGWVKYKLDGVALDYVLTEEEFRQIYNVRLGPPQ